MTTFLDAENEVLDDMQRQLDIWNECGIVYLLS